MHLEPGQWISGEFRIVRPLAQGGMGAVFVAEQRGTGKLRALKTLHAPIAHDAGAVERFVREARVGAAIASEHVVEVVSAGVDQATGVAFIAMELLEGDTLEARIESQGPMHPADVLLVFRQLAHALSAAHRVGIVHRDLKPQNVMLVHARRGDSPFTVKVLDFGIAKIVESATSAGNSQVIGSPPWMAPEQLDSGSAITPATDVWSIGLIAFYLLTGRVYWLSASASIPALVAEILLAPVVAASERARALDAPAMAPPAFDAWFARAVARSPADRFASVDEMVAAFAAIVGASPSDDFASSSSTPAAGALAPMVAARPLASTVATSPPEPLVRSPASHAPLVAAKRSMRGAHIVVVVVACLGAGVLGGFGLMMRVVAPAMQQAYLSPLLQPAEDPEAVAACRQTRDCCAAVRGAHHPSCARRYDGWTARNCMLLTRSFGTGGPLPAACTGPPADAVQTSLEPIPMPSPRAAPSPPRPTPPAPIVLAPPAAGAGPSMRPTVAACVRATRCCRALVDAQLSAAADECDTVQRNHVVLEASAACDSATRVWAERFRSAGRPVVAECAIDP